MDYSAPICLLSVKDEIGECTLPTNLEADANRFPKSFTSFGDSFGCPIPPQIKGLPGCTNSYPQCRYGPFIRHQVLSMQDAVTSWRCCCWSKPIRTIVTSGNESDIVGLTVFAKPQRRIIRENNNLPQGDSNGMFEASAGL